MADISKIVLPSGNTYNIKDASARSDLTYANVTYGTCSTAAGTAEKAVTLATGVTGWELQPGAIIAVKYTNTNTAAAPKLNVNSTGAKSIYYKNAVVTNLPGAGGYKDNCYEYMYDGTNYVFLGQLPFVGATADAAGLAGTVPQPAAGNQGKFLRGDGTWQKPTDTVYTHPTYTAVDGKPDEDATPGFGGTFTVTDITTNTLGHVTAGTSRTITIPDATMTAATAEAAGTKGLVPAPGAGKQASFLRGDGTWVVPTNTQNTTGTTNDTTNKLFVVGAKTQAANPVTYSNSNVYVSSNHLYSNNKQVVNLSDTQALTNKTYNGYTLAAASAKGVDTSISSTTSTNLPTSAAVASYVSEVLEPITTALSGGMHYRGVTTTALTDGAATSPIVINSNNYTPESGDIVIYGSLEFIFSTTDNKWHEFGSTGSLKALAFKDSASTSYKPAGSVSQPTFDGTSKTITVTGTPEGTIGIGTGTANYTPEGSVGTPTITVTLNTASKYVASSASGGGSVTAGSAASCTLPELTTSVANETLTFGWTSGSFTANTPTAVTLPSFASQTIATSVKSATSSKPSFTGTGKELVFTGASLTSSGTYKPEGTVSKPTFSGTSATITVS